MVAALFLASLLDMLCKSHLEMTATGARSFFCLGAQRQRPLYRNGGRQWTSQHGHFPDQAAMVEKPQIDTVEFMRSNGDPEKRRDVFWTQNVSRKSKASTTPEQRRDHRPDGVLALERLGGERRLQYDVIRHVREHRIEILALHGVGEGVNVSEIDNQSSFRLNCRLRAGCS